MKKTAEETALEKYPIVETKGFDPHLGEFTYDSNKQRRRDFIQGYNYRESLVAAEKEEAVKALIEIKKSVQWMWDNLGDVHDCDRFNIPANSMGELDRIINLLTP